MKIIADAAIPFLKGVLEPYADLTYIKGDAITAADVRTADALLIRTRTRCNAALLEGSSVKMIATATIGFDHIDLDYCHSHGIRVVTAAGCNARGVLQWVAGALVYLSKAQHWSPAERTLGIVGVGHVGSLIKQYAETWGFRVVCCDPPREAREHVGFLPLAEVAAQADLITFHTPLDETTRGLVNTEFLRRLHPDCVVINSSRGAVIRGADLLQSGHPYVLDVWEHEPALDPVLLARAMLATPHIAGYSAQGKANATSMSVQALSEFFDLPLKNWYPPQVTPIPARSISWQELCVTSSRMLDLEAESLRLKNHRDDFEAIRDHYNYRNEYF
ncbi:MAG: 4-phosphoerythronate dehydrogenase [Alistipes sp.]